MRRHHLIVSIVACVCSLVLGGCAGLEGLGVERPYAATFASAAVACDQPIASEAGAEMLRAGGNAVDAAVAASFTLSVVRPYSCGIGGGGFMVIHLEDDPRFGDLDVAINYRETCPAGVGATYYEDLGEPDASTVGGTAVAVPGTVAGLLHALEKYGTLDRATVLAPAIRAARDGFEVDEHYAHAAASVARKFEAHPEWKQKYEFVWLRFLQEGEVKAGDRIVVPEQALVLTRIAANGVSGFNSGETGDAIVRAARAAGGSLTLADLQGYAPVEVEPISVEVGGLRFVGMPPPSSGGVTMFEALQIMDELGRGPRTRVDTPAEVHVLAEALKHAFADRAHFLADPAFAEVPTGMLLSRETARAAAARFDPHATHPPEDYGVPVAVPEDAGTSHLCVIDARGNAVACTETINTEFGSLVSPEGCGFALNDEMDDFTTISGGANVFGLRQSDANLPAPGKRPLSSMSPTMVLDSRGVVAIAGASGGPRIITGTMQALMNALSGMDAGAAVAAPRVHHQWMPDRLDLEPGAMAEAGQRAALEALGHTLGERDAVGNVQLIKRVPGGWQAACDPRKGGRPAGM